jgi:hypothetical protein
MRAVCPTWSSADSRSLRRMARNTVAKEAMFDRRICRLDKRLKRHAGKTSRLGRAVEPFVASLRLDSQMGR